LADFVEFQYRERQSVLDGLEYIPQFMHAIEDASIPWRSPDGREFYRIRTGLVYEPAPASWPCGYVLPEDYARLPHVRDKKAILRAPRCRPETNDAQARISKALIKALNRWAQDVDLPEPKLELEVADTGSPREGLINLDILERFRRVLTP
jgi:hypothetical protein